MHPTFMIAAVGACLAMPSGVAAGVSDDLVFCSKLTAAKERIACYDAAARIAANGPSGKPAGTTPTPTSVRSTPQPSASSNAALLPTSPAAATDRHSGPFVLVFGGLIPGLQDVANSDFSRINAKTLGVGAGFNWQFGQIVTGTEARIRKDFGDFSTFASNFNVTSFPIHLGLNCCGSPLPTGDISIGGFSSSSSSAQRGWGSDLSWRIGLAPTDWLLAYARLGGGVQEFKSSSSVTFGSLTCKNYIASRTIRSDGLYVDDIVGCGTIEPQSTTSTVSRINYVPYYLIGTGAEAAFGQFFIRGEVELRNFVNHPNIGVGTQFYDIAANLGAGVRF